MRRSRKACQAQNPILAKTLCSADLTFSKLFSYSMQSDEGSYRTLSYIETAFWREASKNWACFVVALSLLFQFTLPFTLWQSKKNLSAHGLFQWNSCKGTHHNKTSPLSIENAMVSSIFHECLNSQHHPFSALIWMILWQTEQYLLVHFYYLKSSA